MPSLRAGSLRLRLLLAAALMILMAMVVAVVVMEVIFTRHLEQNLTRELTRDAVQIVAALQLDGSGKPTLESPPADPRFDLPGSGRYWQLDAGSLRERSRSLWDESLPASPKAQSWEWSSRASDGPFKQRLWIVERAIQLENPRGQVIVQVAQDLSELHTARREFRMELATFLGILWAVLVTAAWMQVSLGLRPLLRVRQELAVMERSPSARLAEHHPHEILPLTSAINKLAQAREKDLARARRRAADLAHSLKTPLAALAAQSRRAREAGADEAADGLDRAIAAAAAAVEAELARSRAAAARAADTITSSQPHLLAERLIEVIERTEAGARVVFENDIAPTLTLQVGEEDLTEILGALMENAARFANRRVRVTSETTRSGTTLCIEDDGAGLNISTEQALLRGGRLDESGHAHHGLGLSIANDLVEATQGGMSLHRSALGGLQVMLTWPDQAPD